MRSGKQSAKIGISAYEYAAKSRCLSYHFLVGRPGHLQISHVNHIVT